MDRPLKTYEQNRTLGWTRIDLILAVFDGILRQLELARAKVEANDVPATDDLLARARIGISALAAGAGSGGNDLSANFASLYDYVLRRLSPADAGHISEALGIMDTLRTGFRAARGQARELERQGAVAPLGTQHIVQASA
jgi:flagellar biosynthetic protein FliS